MKTYRLPIGIVRRRLRQLTEAAARDGRVNLAEELDRLADMHVSVHGHLSVRATEADAEWLLRVLESRETPSTDQRPPHVDTLVADPSPTRSEASASVPEPTVAGRYTVAEQVTDVLANVSGDIERFLAAARRRGNPGLGYFLVRESNTWRDLNIIAGWRLDSDGRLALLRSGHLTTYEPKVENQWTAAEPGPYRHTNLGQYDSVEIRYKGRAAKKLLGVITRDNAVGNRWTRQVPFPGTSGSCSAQAAHHQAVEIRAAIRRTADLLGLRLDSAASAMPIQSGPTWMPPLWRSRLAIDSASSIAATIVLLALAALILLAYQELSNRDSYAMFVLPVVMVVVLRFTGLPKLMRIRRKRRHKPPICRHCGAIAYQRICRRCGRVADPSKRLI